MSDQSDSTDGPTYRSDEKPSFTPRRRGSLRPLNAIIRPISRKAVGSKSMRLADLLDHWADVVGPQFAEHTAPIKVIAGKGQQDGTIQIAISAGFARIWQHAEPQLLARINDYLGGAPRITRVALKHQSRPAAPPVKRRAVGAATRKQLSENLDGVENPALRDSLERLGLALLSRGK